MTGAGATLGPTQTVHDRSRGAGPQSRQRRPNGCQGIQAYRGPPLSVTHALIARGLCQPHRRCRGDWPSTPVVVRNARIEGGTTRLQVWQRCSCCRRPWLWAEEVTTASPALSPFFAFPPRRLGTAAIATLAGATVGLSPAPSRAAAVRSGVPTLPAQPPAKAAHARSADAPKSSARWRARRTSLAQALASPPRRRRSSPWRLGGSSPS